MNQNRKIVAGISVRGGFLFFQKLIFYECKRRKQQKAEAAIIESELSWHSKKERPAKENKEKEKVYDCSVAVG